jgi:dTDP-glucose 4,6-dehydratase
MPAHEKTPDSHPPEAPSAQERLAQSGAAPKRVLVTGGSGFIGSNFLLASVKALPQAEFTNIDALTYAGRAPNLTSLQGAPNYRFREIDIRDRERVTAVVQETRPDVVFHFAAESHVDRSIKNPGVFIETNINGTYHLLEAVRAVSPETLFHHVSTDEVYGTLGPTGYFEETTPYDPSSPYSASKAASDHLVRAYGRTFGLRTRITNCSNNYGPFQFPEKLIPLMIQNALHGKPLPIYGQGTNVRDWLYVLDHVEALWSVYERGRDGETYNIGGSAEAENIAIVGRICQLVARQTNRDPEDLMRLITYVADRPGHDHRYAINASKIRTECGWAPRESLDSGLEKTVAWYLRHEDWVRAAASGEHQAWIEKNYGSRKGLNQS